MSTEYLRPENGSWASVLRLPDELLKLTSISSVMTSAFCLAGEFQSSHIFPPK